MGANGMTPENKTGDAALGWDAILLNTVLKDSVTQSAASASSRSSARIHTRLNTAILHHQAEAARPRSLESL